MIALCVGHSRPVNGRPEGGAVSRGGLSEWAYNSRLAGILSSILTASGQPARVWDHYEGAGYGSAMRWLADDLRAAGATAAVELHFNDAENTNASGHEWLHWHASAASRALAGSLEKHMKIAVPEIRARGLKPITHAERGAEFLRLTSCPAVIAEPFFGSSPLDWAIAAGAGQQRLAAAMAAGLAAWLNENCA